MTKISLAGVALIAMLGVAACDRDNNRAANMPRETPGAAAPADTARAGAVALTAGQQTFVQKASQSNQAEIDAAKMAQDKGQNERLKDVAEKLEQDHSQALDDLKSIAKAANVPVDTTPPAEKASQQDELQRASGRAFDRAWVEQLIPAHKQSIATFEQQQSTATGELKAFIDRTLPLMRDHLKELEALQKEMGQGATR